MNYNDIKIYRCFSKNQRDFLLDEGLRYIVMGRDMNSLNPFWAFIKCKELTIALAKWTLANPENEELKENIL